MSARLFFPLLVALLGVSAPALAQSEEEDLSGEAEEELRGAPEAERRTLAERIPSVTRRSFRKAGRMELVPALGLSLNDPFYNEYILQGGLVYHLTESLGVSASGDFYLAQEATVDVSGGIASRPDYNRLTFAARLELVWAPFYGKLSLFAEEVVHFDTYVSVGGGLIGPSETDPAVAGTISIGQHYFLSRWLALRVDLRDQIFAIARNPSGSNDKQLTNLLTFTVGLAFYVPSDFQAEEL